jgi:hypothetical protein
MVILDACRNNPFGRSWRSGTRAVSRGLGDIEVDDVLVIYAAAPGQTANDGDGRNSPFATSFAQRLVQPDLPIQLLGGSVRDDVLASTGGSQRPFVSASITGTPVYLVPRTGGASTPARAPAASVPVAVAERRLPESTTAASPSSPAPGAASSAGYRRGQWVLGRADGGFWFPGIVEEAADGRVAIIFDDGARRVSPAAEVKPYNWTKGTRIMCIWRDDGRWYAATVTQESDKDGALGIRYDDGTDERTTSSRCRSS